MPACVAMTISIERALAAGQQAPFRSPFSSEANGSFSFHSGCWGASALTRSRANASWKYIGCSAHSVPSLSKMAMRSVGGTKSLPPFVVTRLTKSTIDCLALPSFHEPSASAACACAAATASRHVVATRRKVRRVMTTCEVAAAKSGKGEAAFVIPKTAAVCRESCVVTSLPA